MPQNTSERWKSLSPEQRQQALSRMSPEQKQALAVSLGYKDRGTSAPSPVQKPEQQDTGFLGGVGSELLGGLKGMASLFAPPQTPGEMGAAMGGKGSLAVYRILNNEAQSRGEAFKQAGQQWKTAGTTPNPVDRGLGYARSAATAASGALPVPGMGAIATNLNKVADTGNIPELWGRGLADIGMLALGGKKAKGGISRLKEVDPVTGLERVVRNKIAPGLRPVNTHAFDEIVKIARQPDILPTVVEYAKRTNNPMRDHLQIGRAAQDAGKEVTSYYQENFIEPNKDIPAGNSGKTIGQAYQRLVDINQQLHPPYLKGGIPGPELTGQAMIDLNREAAELNKSVYGTLSERSGIPADQIKRINQRGAELSAFGRQLETSQTAIDQGVAGYDRLGNALPHSPYHPVFQMIIKAANRLRGGEKAIAGRQARGAVRNFPKGYEPLPSPEKIANYRKMVERNELGQMSSRLARQEARQEALRARQEELLRPARAIQERARSLRKDNQQ